MGGREAGGSVHRRAELCAAIAIIRRRPDVSRTVPRAQPPAAVRPRRAVWDAAGDGEGGNEWGWDRAGAGMEAGARGGTRQ